VREKEDEGKTREEKRVRSNEPALLGIS